MFSDQALQCQWCYLATLQTLATRVAVGKKAGVTKPFDKLRVDDLREELRVRGILTLEGPKPKLQQQLEDILKGVQRVPALLLLNPIQSLSTLNLQRCELVACEPLHDPNLLHDLQHFLTDPISTKPRPFGLTIQSHCGRLEDHHE